MAPKKKRRVATPKPSTKSTRDVARRDTPAQQVAVASLSRCSSSDDEIPLQQSVPKIRAKQAALEALRHESSSDEDAAALAAPAKLQKAICSLDDDDSDDPFADILGPIARESAEAASVCITTAGSVDAAAAPQTARDEEGELSDTMCAAEDLSDTACAEEPSNKRAVSVEATRTFKGSALAKPVAQALLGMQVELYSRDEILLNAMELPRAFLRPFGPALTGNFEDVAVVSYDNADESDASRLPNSWRLPYKDYAALVAWAKVADPAYKESDNSEDGAARSGRTKHFRLPPWLEVLIESRPSSVLAVESEVSFFNQVSDSKPLLAYQREGIRFGVAKNGCLLLADEMGLGKTVQAIGIASQWQDEWPVLVVCPASLRGVWKDQLLQWTALTNDEVQTVYSGSDVIRPTAKWIVVSYALLALKPELRLYKGHENAEPVPYKVVILDECHYVKNPEAARTQACMAALREAKRRICVSGTPVLNSAMELYPILALLEPCLPSCDVFGKRYFKSTEKKFGKVAFSDPLRERELNAYLTSTVMVRRVKADVLSQLPPLRRQVVKLDDVDSKAMERVRKLEDAVFGADSDDGNDKRIAEVMELVSDVKAKSCCAYVEQLIDGGIGKFLLFAHHRKLMNALELTLKKRIGSAFIRIDGSTPQKVRPDLVKRFQEELECHVALLSITALAEGQTLTSAEAVVFAEFAWVPGLILQCEARAHRLGQCGSVLVQFLMLENSRTDRACYKRLNAKHRHTGKVLDGVDPGVLLEDPDDAGQGKTDVCSGTDVGGLRAKARCKPPTALQAHPKSRALPSGSTTSWSHNAGPSVPRASSS
eukprot:TRINITY_DN71376_c0_g1_i1.p1 TRINITY_DN71376_c0_g1~~TRINITY_DN71376_c0_g1_i1.p1  ORF type:complete len:827 (-),score=122.80 TRINITY_DN71376_c0_g1_i1:292-2772(-)